MRKLSKNQENFSGDQKRAWTSVILLVFSASFWNSLCYFSHSISVSLNYNLHLESCYQFRVIFLSPVCHQSAAPAAMSELSITICLWDDLPMVTVTCHRFAWLYSNPPESRPTHWLAGVPNAGVWRCNNAIQLLHPRRIRRRRRRLYYTYTPYKKERKPSWRTGVKRSLTV